MVSVILYAVLGFLSVSIASSQSTADLDYIGGIPFGHLETVLLAASLDNLPSSRIAVGQIKHLSKLKDLCVVTKVSLIWVMLEILTKDGQVTIALTKLSQHQR
jgi:hypothetical protein